MYMNAYAVKNYFFRSQILHTLQKPENGMEFAPGPLFILSIINMSKKLVIIKVKLSTGNIAIPKIISKRTGF